MASKKRQRIRYLNTDLDLESDEDLRPLTRALARRDMYVLHVGRASERVGANSDSWWASLEANAMARTPMGHIRGILKAVESLDGRARVIWDRCTRRDFNIGYECGEYPHWGRFNNSVSSKTLQRLAKVGLSLRITLYPPSGEQGSKE